MCTSLARAGTAGLATLVLALALALPGCFSFSHMDRDRSTRPETAVGTRGTIMMPGESAPTMGGGGAPASSSSGTASSSSSSGGTTSSSQTGSGSEAATDDDMTMIGGATGESDASTSDRETPIVGPLLTLFGYPFWINEQH